MICIASSTGVISRSKRSERPASTPSGTPTSQRERDRDEHQRERLHALVPEPERRERGEARDQDRGGAAAAEAEREQPAEHGRARPGEPRREQVVEPADESVEAARDPVDQADRRGSDASWRSRLRASSACCRGSGVSECHDERVRPGRACAPAVRWQITIAPTIAPTSVVRLRHHGRCSRMTAGRWRRWCDGGHSVALAGDRREHGVLVDDADDAVAVDRAARPLARRDHGHGVPNGRRHVELRAVLLACRAPRA